MTGATPSNHPGITSPTDRSSSPGRSGEVIPKLTDDAISRLPLEAGRAELLEEIMSTVAPDRQNDTLAEPDPVRASRRLRWVAPVAAAAVVAGLAGGTVWWQQ